MKDKFTPNYIESLEENEIFGFGSNLDGYHIGGAAMIAKERFGAVWRQGFLNHPILGERLRAVTKALLTHTDMDVVDILGKLMHHQLIGKVKNYRIKEIVSLSSI